MINNGTIRGYATDTIAFTTAVDFSGTLENSTLYITNGSGFIYGGLMTGPAYGYYLEVGATNRYQWVSGASRVFGSVNQE